MVNRRQKEEMRDYLVDRLKDNYGTTEPRSKQIYPGAGDTDYLLLGNKNEKGIVLMVNRNYTRNDFESIYNKISANFDNFGIVYFKDGINFFRSSAKENHYKTNLGLSLKEYDSKDIQRMIKLRPEEKHTLNRRRRIQYYQPESPRLNQGIVDFSFSQVRLNYDHIDHRERFKPENTFSKKLYIWDPNTRRESSGNLRLEGKYLMPLNLLEE